MKRNAPVLRLKTVRFYLLFVPAVILLFQACPPRRPAPPGLAEPALTRLPRAQYPEFWDDMAYDGMITAINNSLSYLARLPDQHCFRFGRDRYSVAHLIQSLRHFRALIHTNPSAAVLNSAIRDDFLVYRSVGGRRQGQVLFTGYYEPNLHGSLNCSERFRYPVYARPEDLVTIDLSLFSSDYDSKPLVGRMADGTIIPYYDRNTIDKGSLEGKARVLAWVDDPVDLFFLHIQGSGRIYLDTGGTLNVHYHISNGKPYRSIGKYLIEQDKVARSEMSMQAIRAYLQAHPEEMHRVFSHNPSYVFFKTETEGPVGCLDVRLTPGRSLALDRRIFPLATLSFIETKKPLVDGYGDIEAWTDCTRFVLNQDTGGAIRGPGRGDLFWGNGAYAEIAAGHMQHPGRLYFLVLKPGGI